ncbi:hypothetical protein [Photobacterium leiognathi]|nr:hypothetical protein [Photobacterium leiognathi]
MTDKSKKVTENSDFIITLNSLTRFVLGAVGGYNMQTKLKGVREMNDGSIFNSSHTLEIEKDLLLFFNTWVDIQGDKFSNDRKGFQLVTTLIQALGLVFHHIWHCCSNMSKTERTHQIYIAAKKLAQINYSRDAEHWKNCSFLTLNEDDLNYKVNSGGSTTRKHFARYLCSKIGFNY